MGREVADVRRTAVTAGWGGTGAAPHARGSLVSSSSRFYELGRFYEHFNKASYVLPCAVQIINTPLQKKNSSRFLGYPEKRRGQGRGK